MNRIVDQVIKSSILAGFALTQTNAFAVDRTEVSSKVLYNAVNQLTDYLGEDLSEISKHTKKTAIVNLTLSEDLPPSVQHYLVKRLEFMGQKNKRTPVNFVQCIECLSLHAVAEGDEIFIRKGITDDVQLQKTMNKLGINKYSDINLAYTGDELVMQVAVVDKNKLVDWANEYKTPYKAYTDSQWEFGIGGQVASLSGLTSTTGVSTHLGQRLTGFGSVGLNVAYHQAKPGLPATTGVSTYVGVSHNEIFNQYWNYVRLSYEAGVGVTDFNGNQLLSQTIGIKTILGKYYSIALHGKMHQFASAPTDDSPIDNPEGESLLANDEVLPTMITLTLGAEFF